MATLIQSKQIEGIVTASVINGEFLVSGSLIVTGSNSILGAVTASTISSSFVGDGSGITNITYSQIENTPQFVGGNNITITSSSNVITVHAQLDGTGSDAQSLSISGDQLTILGGNTVTIPTGSGVSDYTQLTNVPSGIISGSSQITITQSQISDLSHTDISSLNTFSASIQSEVDSLTAATSSYITSIPQGTISGSEQLPQGLISGSSQITITESQISDLTHYTDSDVKTKLDTEGVLSGSLVSQLPSGVISGSEQLPSGLISGSSQITITQSQISDLTHTSVDSLNTFSSSIQSQVDSLTSATSSYLTTVPSGTISGSEQLPQGLISGSSQITITESQISDLSHYTNSDVQSYIDSIGVVSGSVVAELPSGVISGSSQLPSGLISGSQQVIDSLPSGVVSGSSQITISSSQITDLTHTQIPSGTISGSEQLPQGLISGSTQVVDSLPSGVISGSSQITITESQISDLSHTDISSLNTFTSSIQSEVDSLTAATSSYLTSIDSGIVSSSTQVTELLPSGVISGSSQLPSGVVSGSSQVTDGSGIVSSSVQVISHLPQGIVSGSSQTIANLPSGVVSGSFSSSMATAVELLNEVSGANYLESKSVDSRLDTIEGSIGFYYDLSNTVWNNKYIKSGSGEASDTTGFQTGNVPFKFTLNADRKLNYQVGDVVYISNFDRDTTITTIVSSSYETGSREIGFTVISVNQSDSVTRINDSYWVLSRHTAGFVDSASYTDASASFDYRIDGIVASGSGADWNVNLYNKPSGIVSSSQQQYTASIQNGFALTSSLNEISNSLDTKIENVFLSSSNFDNKSLVSGSSQIDLRNTTNYVADEHIDHTTVLINAGDGLDGGGDISNSRTLTLNVTSSHFEGGVTDILTSEGVVKQSTLDTDLVDTDFSQSVDSRIDAISSAAVPSGTVSGSTQIDITQTQNYTSFSSSIASDINSLSVGTTDISHLNTFTSSADTRITNLENFSSSLDASFATDSELTSLSSSIATTIDNIQHTQIPSGTVSGSTQITDGSGLLSASVTFEQYSASVQTTIDNIVHTSIPSGTVSGSTQVTISDTDGYTAFSSSLSASIYEAAQSGSGQSSIDTGSFATTGSNTFVDSQYISGSIIPEASGGNGLHDLGSTSNPFRELYITTGSVRFVKDGSVVSRVSGEENAIRVGEVLITTASIQQPIGLISGSIVGSGSVSVTSGSGIITISSTGGGASTWEELSGIPSGLVSSSDQLASDISGAFYAPSASIAADIASLGGGTYDGNRIISNEDLGDLFTNQVNVGTSGSLVDFINAVFFPNTAASFTNANFTIEEWSGSGDIVGTLTATDPEGQSLTFATASSYTDGYVAIASNGQVTLTRTADSSSFNTTFSGSGHGHEFTAEVTDTFGTSTTKDFYLFVTPNTAPVFRETSVAGNVITSVTANLNENSTDNTLVKRVYFTDTDGDSITIYSSSIDNNHFDIEKFSTYVDIRQNTSSLDYEQQTQYTFSISASDEHYESGDDSDSITSMLITVNVTDNLTPTVSDQTLSSINENSSNGATVGTISAADNEGDTITFKNFELHQLQLDGSTVSSGSYSGTSQLTDPHENPFQMSSSGVVTRKTGVYLNSDLINKYIYRVQVTDGYNGDSNVGLVTINITDDIPATLSDNWSTGPFIKESEVSGTTIKTTNYGSTTADYGSNQSGTWSSSNPAISINSNGNLSLGVDLSGSVTQSGDTLDSTITFTNTFGTTTTDNVSVTVVGNSAPTATFTNQSSNFNTNLATTGTNLVSVTISDVEGDTPYSMSLSGTDAWAIKAVPQNSNSSSYQIQVTPDTASLAAGSYSYDVVVTDNYGESTTYSGRSFTIAQATTGSLSVTNAYVIESATNGDQIKRTTNGLTGNQSYVSVAYSPDYGSQSATSFASSNNLISINSSTGYLSVGNDISGSGNVAGDTITTTISWTDQYGNNGSTDIDITVTQNNAPTVSSTSTSNLNTNQARSTNQILQLTVSDTESDTIPNSGLSFSGYDTTYFSPSISTPFMRLNVNNINVPAGTYPYTASLTDVHGFSTNVVSGSFTIAQADSGTLIGDTAIYIIESAVSGAVYRDATGYNNGSPAQLSVSYSPSYGSPSVQTFTTESQLLVVDSNGNMTLGVDLSGSVTQSGYTTTQDIGFTDQYGNSGTGTVSITVFGNSAPSATFTAASFNTDEAISGSNIGTVTVTDTENNSPFTITLGGTDGGKFDVSGSSSPFTIQPTGSLAEGSYSINITVTDTYGESVTLTNESITVSAAEVLDTMYVYTLPIDGTYANVNGITANGSGTPPEPTIATSYGFFTAFVDSDTLGDSTITVSYGSNYTATRRAVVSGSNVDTALDGVQMSIGLSERVYIFIPSGSSTLGGVPTSLTTSDPGSSTTAGEYVLFVANEDSYQGSSGGLSNDIKSANIHKLTLDTAVDGYTDWFVIGTNDRYNAGNSTLYVRLTPSSGSVPS